MQAIRVLRHKETPGLGSKIGEPRFLRFFSNRSVDNTTWRLRKDGGDVPQVTGATMSSSAVVEALNDVLRLYLKNRDQIHALPMAKED